MSETVGDVMADIQRQARELHGRAQAFNLPPDRVSAMRRDLLLELKVLGGFDLVQPFSDVLGDYGVQLARERGQLPMENGRKEAK